MEIPRFYSDGIVGNFAKGKDYFAGFSFEELLTQSMVDFAQSQMEKDSSVFYDLRLIYASEHNALTAGLLTRYIECRRIYNVTLILTPDGEFGADIHWLKDYPPKP